MNEGKPLFYYLRKLSHLEVAFWISAPVGGTVLSRFPVV